MKGDLGLHTWQRMYGCELWRNGSKGGFLQYGYEGRTFITFDKETLTWVAPDIQAQITKRKWDALPQDNHRDKSYLEEECIEWLERYLSYRNETLQSTEPPGVTVVRGKTEVEDGMETHARLDGFYPREIDASWTRDGEVWEEETFHGSLAPNVDGTYHYWLSIRIDPKERGAIGATWSTAACRSLWTWPWKREVKMATKQHQLFDHIFDNQTNKYTKCNIRH
ncbi:putative MHC class I antigen protein [Naja naja]|nr:putative MHC class I antigen protein [Naja naja]